MSEFKGTKGKWVGKEDEGIFLENGDKVIETGCGCCISRGLDKYDALLMAHAPEMLEMLMLIENSLRRGYITDKNKLGTIQQLIKSATELK